MTTIAFQNRPVLVLNRNWTAIGVHSLKNAICKLFACYNDGTPKAHVIDVVYPDGVEQLNPTSFEKYNWADWSKLRPEPEKENEVIIAGRGRVIRLPKVIALSRYDKMPTQHMNFNRRALYRRDDNRCQYCGCRPGMKLLSLEHVTPKFFGGKTTWENVVLACVECNSKKANRTPEQAGMKLLSIPKKPKYSVIRNTNMVYKCWSQFVSDMYFEVELQNDN